MAGRVGAKVPSEQRFCAKCGQETEHRRYRVRPDYKDGEPRYQWRCYVDLRKSDRRAKDIKKAVEASIPQSPDRTEPVEVHLKPVH